MGKKDQRISLLVSKEEKEKISQRAEELNLDRNTYLRRLVEIDCSTNNNCTPECITQDLINIYANTQTLYNSLNFQSYADSKNKELLKGVNSQLCNLLYHH